MSFDTDVLSRIALLRRASTLNHGLKCSFVGDPIERVDQTILRIHFPGNGTTWAAKIPFEQQWPFYEITVRPLEYLARKHPGIPAPRVHGYVDAGGVQGEENLVGVAYLLIDWMEGSHMQPWGVSEPSLSAKHRVLDQLADLMLGMLSKNAAVDGDIHFYGVPEGTPKNTAVSTAVWLTESIDRALRRHLRQKKTSIMVDNLMQRSMLARYLVAEHNTSHWAAFHPDLHNANIIVDEDRTSTGLIDWDLASAQPLRKWAVFPKLIEHMPGEVPPHLPAAYTHLDFGPDRADFVAVLAEKETPRHSTLGIAQLVESSTERAFFEMSHHTPTVHREFAERFCHRTPGNVAAARRELGRFLGENLGIGRDDGGVREVERELEKLWTDASMADEGQGADADFVVQ